MRSLLSKFDTCLWAKYKHIENDGSFAIIREGDALVLLFEKSNGLTDWRNNFNFPAKPYRDMNNLWFCHRGFLKVWKSIEPYIAKEVCDISVKKIDIIGYSHGGAIAQLCFEYVKFNRPDVEVSGVGFGSPRVFWGFACKAVKARFNGFKVIRNGNDIITHLPPVFLGFRHICEIVRVGESKGLIKDHYPSRYREALKALKCEDYNCTDCKYFVGCEEAVWVRRCEDFDSVRKEDELYEKGYNDAIKDIEELVRGMK